MTRPCPLTDLLDRFDQHPTERIRLAEITTLEELQPRDLETIQKASDRRHRAHGLGDMVEHLKEALRANPRHPVNPVWIVERKNKLYLVDGHHRLAAHQAAKGVQTISAKVLRDDTPWPMILKVSRIANTQGTQYALHRDEAREAMWRTLSELLECGDREWSDAQSEGYSYSRILALMGQQVARGTVSSMVNAIPRIAQTNPKQWPTWSKARKEMMPHWEPPEEADAERIERLALAMLNVKGLSDTNSTGRRVALDRVEEMLEEIRLYGRLAALDDEDDF